MSNMKSHVCKCFEVWTYDGVCVQCAAVTTQRSPTSAQPHWCRRPNSMSDPYRQEIGVICPINRDSW